MYSILKDVLLAITTAEIFIWYFIEVKHIYNYLIYCEPFKVNLQVFSSHFTCVITIDWGIQLAFWWKFLNNVFSFIMSCMYNFNMETTEYI